MSMSGVVIGMVRIRRMLSSIRRVPRRGRTACIVGAVGTSVLATAGWLVAATIVLPSVTTILDSAWFVFLSNPETA